MTVLRPRDDRAVAADLVALDGSTPPVYDSPPGARPRPASPLPRANDLAAKLSHSDELAVPQWWRRLLRLGPDAATRAAHERALVMQASFTKPITIMVASPKGSSGKTPTARCLGAAFANARGGGVVVVDNNELRGTLAARSMVTHEGNIGDVLRASQWFTRPEATLLDLERTMHRQPNSHEWILGSDHAAEKALTGAEFETIHRVLTHYFPLVVVDTGNNELAGNWLAALRTADLLVVPMKWRRDHTLPAAQMLDDLLYRKPELLSRTVIVGTNGPGDSNPQERADALEHFGQLPIVEIPTDPALQTPTISWPRLQPATRVAYEDLAVRLCDLVLNTENPNR